MGLTASAPLIAVSSGSLYTYGLARFFELASVAGAEAVEVIVDGRWDTFQPHYLLRLAREHRLPIVALHAPFWPVKELGETYVGCIEATLRLAEQVGARTVVVHPEWRRQRALASRVAELVRELQEKTSATLSVENMPYSKLVRWAKYPSYTVESLSRFEAITLDTAHFGTAGIDLRAAYRAIAPRVRHVHLSDFGQGIEHLAPGDGELPLDSFLRDLAHDGYDGVVTLELMPEAVRAGQPDETVVEHLRLALEFCRAHLSPRVALASGA